MIYLLFSAVKSDAVLCHKDKSIFILKPKPFKDQSKRGNTAKVLYYQTFLMRQFLTGDQIFVTLVNVQAITLFFLNT